ncbi:hypothetical protein B0T16DRAFT_386472 [Cercophora newfieldiana]|uniref:Uncharacterized protein n=1 Tax=Cercophora newfieldiana TaxID=92897 RepID=A0AA40D099_9PEZI|nr:hypothetical protein B0T16DRAFT_386472 [Cercophora newfieldiana]
MAQDRLEPIERFFRTPRRYRDPFPLWSKSIFPLYWDMCFSGHFTLTRTLLELFLPFVRQMGREIWIPSYGYVKPEKHDPHSWRTSTDHYECATCARLHCRVPPGEVPSREALEEAFEAMNKIWGLPFRGTIWGRDDAVLLSSPPAELDEVMRTGTYMAFCVGLRKKEHQDWAEMYEYCLGEGVFGMEIDPMNEVMVLPWEELLRRFSEAAFKTRRKKYGCLKNAPRKAEEILLPPITPGLLAEVEERLGPLPEDMREMVLVANGFRGLEGEFGGGLPGIDKFEVTPCGSDSWLYLRPDDLTDELSEKAMAAPI